MDETTKQALEAFVVKMLSTIERGAEFSAEQIPLVIQEWLRWQFVYSFSLTCIFSILVGAFILYARMCSKRANETTCSYSVSDWQFAGYVCYAITGIVIIPLIVNLLDVLKILIAPRVVILEGFSHLIR